MSTETVKKPLRERARETGLAIEATAVELSRKFWLAGIGAYGMAYDVTRSGATKANEQSAEMFEDLVKRGGELETQVMSSLGANPTVTAASERVQKVVDTSQKFQERVRETVRGRFETRMEQMRGILRMGTAGLSTDSFEKRLAELEKDIAVATKGAEADASKQLKQRLASLSEAIDVYAGTSDGDASEPATEAPAPAVESDLTSINGVGPAMALKLADAGIATLSDLAALSEDEAAELDQKISARGRVLRDAWVAQAQELIAA
jgi:predicted flap endonuclease-1-like 5' DNA nuclease